MFTGIIRAIGEIEALRGPSTDRELRVRCPRELTDRLEIGASIALDGVCQTVTALGPGSFEVHAIAETLRVTTLGERRVGDRLNLEPALGVGEALGGHFVQGHVDGTAEIESTRRIGDSVAYRFAAPPELVSELVPKGSVCIDGISLTVGPEVAAERFEVYLIPHTLEVTTLGDKGAGDRVNLETDVLGKYVLRFLAQGLGAGLGPTTGLRWADLTRAGFGVDAPGPEEGSR